ncbi:unnamed protein product [Lupinus luteus]|uniref:GDSL esterase/lipase n=1 Tax=Lupinus luteus TaxID=3873 RepID=A0AAV1VSE7_LUPLU
MVKQNQSIMVILPLFLILAISAGNNLNASTYKPPYGVTYPGIPSGRYSDGRVLTDYLVVEELNKEIGKPVVRTLDVYSSFQSAIQTIQKNRKENSTLMNPTEPCCAPLEAGFECGKVDKKGKKQYALCEKPKLSFFWDNAHPSESGWYSVFAQLEPSLSLIIGG